MVARLFYYNHFNNSDFLFLSIPFCLVFILDRLIDRLSDLKFRTFAAASKADWHKQAIAALETAC